MFYACGTNDPVRLAHRMGVPCFFPYENTYARTDPHYRLKRPINYGCKVSRFPDMPYDTVNRNAEAAMSKLRLFYLLSQIGIEHPPLVDPASTGSPFIGRIDGLSRSRGMRVFQPGEQPDKGYDFYVQVLAFSREYRLHVAFGEIILTSLKEPRRGVDTDNVRRNHDRGYRLRPTEIDCGDYIRNAAIRAVAVVGLDFGAVDVYETPEGAQYILEINTAPGLEYQESLVAYSRVFSSLKIPRSKHS